MTEFKVTEAAQRPARENGTCFYCDQPIGSTHKDDCVLVSKKVKVRLTVEYEVSVPASWDAHMIEFHRNDGSWCSDNAIGELERLAESEGGCLCGVTNFKYLNDVSEPFLSES